MSGSCLIKFALLLLCFYRLLSVFIRFYLRFKSLLCFYFAFTLLLLCFYRLLSVFIRFYLRFKSLLLLLLLLCFYRSLSAFICGSNLCFCFYFSLCLCVSVVKAFMFAFALLLLCFCFAFALLLSAFIGLYQLLSAVQILAFALLFPNSEFRIPNPRFCFAFISFYLRFKSLLLLFPNSELRIPNSAFPNPLSLIAFPNRYSLIPIRCFAVFRRRLDKFAIQRMRI